MGSHTRSPERELDATSRASASRESYGTINPALFSSESSVHLQRFYANADVHGQVLASHRSYKLVENEAEWDEYADDTGAPRSAPAPARGGEESVGMVWPCAADEPKQPSTSRAVAGSHVKTEWKHGARAALHARYLAGLVERVAQIDAEMSENTVQRAAQDRKRWRELGCRLQERSRCRPSKRTATSTWRTGSEPTTG